jgi:hypothetical protein
LEHCWTVEAGEEEGEGANMTQTFGVILLYQQQQHYRFLLWLVYGNQILYFFVYIICAISGSSSSE